MLLAHIPVWVFGLLGLLVAIGWRQSRPRVIAPGAVLGIAAGMTAFSLGGVVSAFGAAPLPALGWAVGMAAALTLGARVQVSRAMRLVPASGRVHMPGSWWPLGLMMGIFAVKFALGFAAGVGAPVAGASTAAVTAAR